MIIQSLMILELELINIQLVANNRESKAMELLLDNL